MILALDISTTTIGYTIFCRNKNKLIEASYISLKKEDDLFDKLDKAKEILSSRYRDQIDEIAIEEPLKMFMQGKSSAQTLVKLISFNGMVSGMLYDMFNVKPIYYNATSARKVALDRTIHRTEDKKEVVQEWVSNTYPEIEWEYKPRATDKLKEEMYDLSDSVVVGVCHMKNRKQ